MTSHITTPDDKLIYPSPGDIEITTPDDKPRRKTDENLDDNPCDNAR
jgi:hypothetical protein